MMQLATSNEATAVSETYTDAYSFRSRLTHERHSPASFGSDYGPPPARLASIPPSSHQQPPHTHPSMQLQHQTQHHNQNQLQQQFPDHQQYQQQQQQQQRDQHHHHQQLVYDSTWRGSLQQHDCHSMNPGTPVAPLTLQIPKTQHDLPRINPAFNSSQAIDPQSSFSATTSSASAQSLQRSSASTNTSLPSFASLQEHASRNDDTDEGPEIAPMSSRLSCYSCTKLKPMVREVAVAVAELDESVQNVNNRAVTRTLDFPKEDSVRVVQWVLDRLKYAKADLQTCARREQSGYFYQHSQPGSPSNSLKRGADGWDRDDYPDFKRPRSGTSTTPQARTAFSPPPTESVPGSAYPKPPTSPVSGRGARTLPSPSSLAYPPSAAPSVALGTALDSPAPSYHQSASIHTASTNSVTSAHIADLQHQVTLKSLALQTLQSEYASLLQKLQRERVKSQTIEKKTSVADQEVNELTSRNEELADRVKELETQIDETEKKREIEIADAARDKEQWGRMLEMGGRLQARHAEERQKLVNEKEDLAKRIAALEQDPASFQAKIAAPPSSSPRRDSDRLGQESADGVSTKDVPNLKHENGTLRVRIDHLEMALQTVLEQTRGMDDKARDFLQRTGSIDSTVKEVLRRGLNTHNSVEISDQRPKAESVAPPTVTERLPSLSAEPQRNELSSRRASIVSTPVLPSPSSVSVATAKFTRTSSPSPAELGFHVQPTRSSPDELMKALGPVPAPRSANQVNPSSNWSGPRDANMTRGPPATTQPTSHSLLGGSVTTADQGRFRPSTQVYHQAPSPLAPPHHHQRQQYHHHHHHHHNSPPLSSQGSPDSHHSPSAREVESDSPPTAVAERSFVPADKNRLPQINTSRPFMSDSNPAVAMPPPPRPFLSWQYAPTTSAAEGIMPRP